MARAGGSDPLDKFRFRVTVTGNTNEDGYNFSAGFQACSMPKRNTTKMVYREGVDEAIQFNSAGISSMEDITLSRGLIVGNSDFYTWASAVQRFTVSGNPGAVTFAENTKETEQKKLNNYRREVKIEMLSRAGNPVKTWILHNAFPVNFIPGSDLDASSDDSKSISSLTLTYDDFVES